MKNARFLLICATLAAAAHPAEPPVKTVSADTEAAAAGDAPSMLAPTPAGGTVNDAPTSPDALPAMNFYSSIAATELFDLVKKDDRFGRLERQLWGSPLLLRVTHSLQPTPGGKAAGLMSAIFAGGTLGLLPAVTNNNLVVTYEIRVHGVELTSFKFQRNFTRAVNLWAKDETYGLGKDGLEWLKSTAGEFLAAASGDARLAGLKKEYERYFGAAK